MHLGWYNAYNKNTYIKSDYNYEKTIQIAKNDLNNSIRFFKENPRYAIEFMDRKITSQWNNPTFQCFWINIAKRTKDDNSNIIVKAICGKNILNNIITQYLNILQTLILFGAITYMIMNFKKSNIEQLILAIVFIGGFLFHIIWEAKCQYTITYFILLIPYGIKGYLDLSEIILKKMKKEGD